MSFYTSQMGKPFGTISEQQKLSKKQGRSEGYFEGNSMPPRLTKKMRPYSAPRGPGEMKSIGLKNRVSQSKKKQRPGTGVVGVPQQQ